VQNSSQAAPASLQAPFNALTIAKAEANSAPRKLTYAERLQEMEERKAATQKLFRAVSLNKIASVKELLEKGADPNVLGERDGGSKQYPLYVAATNKFHEVLRLLIENKASLDADSPGCGTALYGAVVRMNEPAVKELLKGGADPDKVGISGYSPLQYAAQTADGNPGIFDALLLAEPEIDLKTRSGTALDIAMCQSQFRTARRLMNLGADPDLVRDNCQHMFKYVPA
jgi:ankyrin repeat protein